MSALANHLWQSLLFAIAAGLLTWAFRGNRARVRYWIWFSASLKFLIPFSLLISLGSAVQWAPAAQQMADRIVTPSVSGRVIEISQPFPAAAAETPPARAPRNWIPIALFGAWACGFACLAFARFRGWRQIRAAIRASSPSPISSAANVAVRSSPGLLQPGVAGFLRPMLLLPEGIEQRLAPAQLEAVLAHEICHIRRCDNLLASVQMLAEALFWFLPRVWWIGARLVEERERACDEAVLDRGIAPRDYAEAIVNVCRFYLEPPLACLSGISGSNLETRIEAIMNHHAPLGLSFVKRCALAGAGIAALAIPVMIGILNAPPLEAQPPPVATRAGVPKFEVASIRRCEEVAGRRLGGGESSPGTLNTGCIPLVDSGSLGLIQRAYVRFGDGHFHAWPGVITIKGGPAWIHSELYEIKAKPEGHPSREMMQGPMMQALLEDRFQLKIHRETVQVPVYDLMVAKGGPKLKAFVEGSCTPSPATFPPTAPPPGKRYCDAMAGGITPSVRAQGTTLADFCKLLNLELDRPVIDKTGLAGRFDIRLEFAADQATPRFLPGGDLHGVFGRGARGGPAPAPANLPTVFTAIQEQLGLKLVPAKGPEEFLVIDHIERPSAN